MNGKSEGTGLLNDKGEVVRGISAKLVDLDPTITKLVNDNFYYLLFQSDGMGFPGYYEEHLNNGLGSPAEEAIKDCIKPTKLKRVK